MPALHHAGILFNKAKGEDMRSTTRHTRPPGWLIGALTLCAAMHAAAGPLVPGSVSVTEGITAFDAPRLAGQSVHDQDTPFSFTGGGGVVSGSIHQFVVRSDLDHTLDFYWRVTLDAGSAIGLATLRIDGFTLPSGSPLWADDRTDSLGEVGSTSAKRSPGVGSDIDFEFNTIAPGQSSLFLLLDTEATARASSGTVSLLALDGSQSLGVPTMVPTAVPEPQTYATLAAGLGVLAFVLRRRRACSGSTKEAHHGC